MRVADIKAVHSSSRNSSMHCQIEAKSLLEATKVMVDQVELNCKTNIKEIEKNAPFPVSQEWEITVFEYLGKEDDQAFLDR